jgi:hypothetical protein
LISFIVSPNGFGHFQRVISVAQKLLEESHMITLCIFCTKKQFSILKNDLINNKRIGWDFTLMEHYPIPNYKSHFKYHDYLKWLQLVEQNEKIKSTTLLISDNIVIPSNGMRNLLLMGSFLWHDVIADHALLNEEIELYLIHDIEILRSTNIKMIANKYMCMPSVQEFTSPVFMPWFCESVRKKKMFNPELNILLTLGGSDFIEKNSFEIIDSIIFQNKYTYYLDNTLYSHLSNVDVSTRKFDFENFSNIDLIICRPGIGILTEAVKWSIPVIALTEPNREINFNSEKVVELGMGCKYDFHSDLHIESVIENFKETSYYCTLVKKIENLETNGHYLSAKYILDQYIK